MRVLAALRLAEVGRKDEAASQQAGVQEGDKTGVRKVVHGNQHGDYQAHHDPYPPGRLIIFEVAAKTGRTGKNQEKADEALNEATDYAAVVADREGGEEGKEDPDDQEEPTEGK